MQGPGVRSLGDDAAGSLGCRTRGLVGRQWPCGQELKLELDSFLSPLCLSAPGLSVLQLLPLGAEALNSGRESAQPAPLVTEAGEHMLGFGFLHQQGGSGDRTLILQVFRSGLPVSFSPNAQSFQSSSSSDRSYSISTPVLWSAAGSRHPLVLGTSL